MTREAKILDLSFTAGEDLSGYQFHAVYQDANDQVVLMDSASEHPIGVLQNAPESGQAAQVRVAGVTKWKANGALTIGVFCKAEYVGATDTGKAQATTTNGDYYLGRVVETAGAEDDLAGVLLAPGFYNTGT